MKISCEIGHLRFSLDKFSGSFYDLVRFVKGSAPFIL